MRGSHRIAFLLALVAALAARCAMGDAASPTAKPTDTETLRRRVEAVYAKLHALEEERRRATRDAWEALDTRQRAVFVARYSPPHQPLPLSGDPAHRAMQFTERQARDYLAKRKARATVDAWFRATQGHSLLLSPHQAAAFWERKGALLGEIASMGDRVAPILVGELDVRSRLATPDWWRMLHREEERRWAAQALGHMRGAAVPHLIAFLDRELGVVRGGPLDLPAYLAMSALAQSADERALPLLRRALHHPDRSVRYHGVDGLWELKDAAAVALLISALEDGDRRVRGHACAALGDFAGLEALPALRELAAKWPTERVKMGSVPSAAVRAIEEIEARLKEP